MSAKSKSGKVISYLKYRADTQICPYGFPVIVAFSVSCRFSLPLAVSYLHRLLYELTDKSDILLFGTMGLFI